jgi:hypothetical protein
VISRVSTVGVGISTSRAAAAAPQLDLVGRTSDDQRLGGSMRVGSFAVAYNGAGGYDLVSVKYQLARRKR